MKLPSREQLRSLHFRSIATLVSGTMAAQVLTVGTAPILTRLYTPADYGLLGVFMSLSIIFTTLATLQYAPAVVLAETDDAARSLLWLGVFISVGCAGITLVGAVALPALVATWLGQAGVASWLLALPIPVVLAGVGATFTGWANRRKRYKMLAGARLAAAVSGSAASVAGGFILHGPLGLLVGYLVGQAVISTLLVLDALRNDGATMIAGVSRSSMLVQASRYRRFPLFSLPTEFLNTFLNQVPIYLLSSLGGAAAVGAYSMGQRILALPVSLISGAVGEVFVQRAAEEYAARGECKALFRASVRNATLFAVPIFLVLALVGASLFAFAFGEPWRVAGEYIRILAPMMMMRFIVSPLTGLYAIAGRQREDLILHLIMLAVLPAAMLIGYNWFGSAEGLLGGFAFAYCAIYLLYLLRSYQFAQGNSSVASARR